MKQIQVKKQKSGTAKSPGTIDRRSPSGKEHKN